MKTNNECSRKVLLEIEKIPFGENLSIAKLQERMPEFSIEDVLSTIALLHKEHFIMLVDKNSYDDTEIFRDHKVKGLFEKGYKALDLVREDDVWNLLKNNLDNFEELSIFTIFNIADKIMNVRYNDTFGLPKEMFVPINRW